MSIARAQDQLVGRSLGEFVLRERIGEGGFGAVYRAIQPALDRDAVVKVLHKKLHSSKAAGERFLREAKLASKLDHPYAAHIYAFGAEPDGQLWIAMELVRGTPLDQVLRIQGALPLERLVPLLDRICEVVHTAHEQGIVHRDLKPANVMVLARAGRMLPKLLDFGIAKGIAGPASASLAEQTLPQSAHDANGAATLDPKAPTTPQLLDLTQRGAIMGSPPYMAPEQWLDAGHVDQRSDQYALGIVAFECLTGRPPFTGVNLTTIARAHARELPPSIAARFPAALDKVFAKVLAKNPNDRYPDALAFAAAFREASGIAAEGVNLPAIDPVKRDAALGSAPQPIAEAVAALDAARNVHQARDAIVQLAHTLVRYLGLLALACRSRVSLGDEPASVASHLRELYRTSLDDDEWLELARELTTGWLGRRDAYPIPELVDALHDKPLVDMLASLAVLRAPSEDALRQLLDKAVGDVDHVLDRLAFVRDYPLVVTAAGGIAERWMGVRRAQRTTMPVHGKGVQPGMPALLDNDGAPVLSLAPLFQIAVPTPGAPADLFLFEGRSPRGAKLVALPAGFEHHDDEVWEWFRAQLAETLDEDSDQEIEEKPPYRGLAPFSAEDGARFFGREKLVDAFANRVVLQPMLAVVGRSGAGKSSFVHAGVLPALRDRWRAIAMRPGAAPLAALAARLEHAGFPGELRGELAADRDALGSVLRADAASRGPILLVIDQLEEIFTLCQDDGERRQFAEAIAAAARAPEDPVRVVFTLRDDFLVRTEQVPALRNRLAQGLQLLTVPGPDELLRIVVEPARRAGYELEGDLAADMVKEVTDQPGALALISFTASKLWELRDRHFKQLTRSAYQALGGVGGALAHHADETLDALPAEEKALAREAFRHLVTTQSTRAVLTRGDLRQILGGSAHADNVIEKLVGARLLVASENEEGSETIEIVHEALLVAWPRLVEWRREDAEGARFREQLRSAAEQWRERERGRGLLWRGDALADFTRWRARNASPLTDVEAAFTTASLAEAARGRRNQRALVASAFATLVAVVVGLIVFNARVDGQRARAELAATELHVNLRRQYENQGRRFVLDGEPLQALAYLAKASDMGAGGTAHDFLVAQAVRATDGKQLAVRHDGKVTSAELSRDGSRLVTAGSDKQARIWDAHSGQLLATLHAADVVERATFSPDGESVLTAGDGGGAIEWNARTGERRREIHRAGFLFCAQYSPDGALVLAAGDDRVLELREVASDAVRLRAQDDNWFEACAFSRDGSLLAAGNASGITRVWDTRTGKLLHELRDQPRDLSNLEFSPDGSRLVVASWQRARATLWDLAHDTSSLGPAHESGVFAARFSPDGQSIVTASTDHTAMVWDVTTGERKLTLTGATAAVLAARYSPDGKYIVTTSEDATARLYDAIDGQLVARWYGHRGVIRDVELDTSGTRAVTASDDGSAIVWNVAPQLHVTWLIRHAKRIKDARFSPDGRRVVVAGWDGASVWDAVSGAHLRDLPGHSGEVATAAFSHDGRSIATGGEDGSVRIWHEGDAPRVVTGASPVHALAWSTDDSVLVAGTANGSLRMLDAATGGLRLERAIEGGADVSSISWFRSGDRFLTAGADYTLRTWNLRGQLLGSHRPAELPTTAVLDPSGERVLTAGEKQTAQIRDAASSAMRSELVGHAGMVRDATWRPDGSFALTASHDETARIWDAESGDLLGIIPHGRALVRARFSPDGQRVLVIDERYSLAVHDLPRLRGTGGEVETVLACRVPFVVQGDTLDSRELPRICDAPRAP